MKLNTPLIGLFAIFIIAMTSCVTEYKKVDGNEDESQSEGEAKKWSPGDFRIEANWGPEDLKIDMILAPFSMENAPKKFRLSNFPPVKNQGSQASGTAWSAGYGAMTYIMREKFNESEYICSPAYIYNKLNGGANLGVELVDVLNLLKTSGCPEMGLMPYREYDYLYKPGFEAEVNASRYKVDGFGRVDFTDVNQVKAHLLQKKPVIFTMTVYENFLKNENFVWSGPVGGPRGRHTMVVIGYDDNNEYFIIQNSAGEEWGDKGYVAIQYAWFIRLVDRAYIIW